MATATPRILVIRRRYLGDVVLLGSVFASLRAHWPGASICVLTEAAYAEVLGLNPDVAHALVFPSSLAGWPRFLRTLRAARFTHVLDFDNNDRTALVTRLSGAPVRVTYDRETNPFRHRWAYTGSARITNAFYTSQHITETYLALLGALDVPAAVRTVRLVPRPADREAVRALLGPAAPSQSAAPSPPTVARAGGGAAARAPRVLVHPGSRSPFRIWPAERFAAVCDRLQDELGAQVFLVAGPGEQALVRAIRSHAQSHLIALNQRLNVGQFAALLAEFDAMLCHDSGPMHVAASVGTPVVALFGSQNAANWRPLGPRHTVLQTPLPCACLGAAAPGACVPSDSYRSYCVRKLEPDLVFAALRATLTDATPRHA
jgi:ADP-heptose:LPS heptosyltransferase